MNPGGKPKGIERRMREIVESRIENWDGRSVDGWEAMTLMMYDVAMGRKPPGDVDLHITMKDRQAAVQFLFDRVHGKATVKIESESVVHQGSIANLDVDSLDPETLAALEAHVELVAAKAAGKATDVIIDAEIVEPGSIVPDPNPDDVP